MASVEGAFIILDRASPALKDIAVNAKIAQHEVDKLGRKLDTIGSSKHVKNLQNVDRSIKTLGRDVETESRRMEQSMRRSDKQTSTFGNSLRMLARNAKGVFGELFALARPGGMILGMGTAIGVAGQAVGALSGGVVGLLPKITDLSGALAPAVAGFTGLGLAMVTTHLAFNNVSKAMSGNKRALQSLTPDARAFVAELRRMRPYMNQVERSAQSGIIPGARFALQRFRAVSPVINQVVRQSSATVGGLIRDASSRFTQQGFLSDFRNIAGQGNVIVRDMGHGLMNLVDALRHVAVAARPFTMWLDHVVLMWTKHIDVMAKTGRESGRLTSFFDRTRSALTLFGHILLNVWHTSRNILRDARPLGDSLWAAAEKTTRGWARVTSTIGNRVKLTEMFSSMAAAIKSILNLVGALGGAIFRMGANNNLAKTVNSLRGLVPAIEKILTGLANTFGPPMAQTLTAFGKVVSDLAGATGPFTLLLSALTLTFNILDKIIKILGPFKGVVTSVLGTALVLRYAAKLGLIEFGWKRIAAAAGLAAEAEAAASGGSFIGPGRVTRGLLGSRGARVVEGGFMTATGAAESRVVGGRGIRGMLSRIGGGAGVAAGAGAALRGGGLLRGAGGLLLRGAGAAGRFLLPLAAISGAFGALTAQRSGGAAAQGLQTVAAGGNAFFGGIPGALAGAMGFHAPQTDSQWLSASQQTIGRSLQVIDRSATGYKRLTDEIEYLQRVERQLATDHSAASKQLLASIQQEIAARRQVTADMHAQDRARGTTKGAEIGAQLNRMLVRLLRTESPAQAYSQTLTSGLGAIRGATGPGAGSVRGKLEAGLLSQLYSAAQKNPALMPVYQRALGEIMSIRGQHLQPGQLNAGYVYRGQIYTGSPDEFQAIRARLADRNEMDIEARSKGLTSVQNMAVASLIAMGKRPQDARAWVASWDATGKIGDPRRNLHMAGGGRIPGMGMQDTVPIGGMAAPGELIVNRHTERDANTLLAPMGYSLGGLVGKEGRKHGRTYAQGGRYHGHPGGISSGVRAISDALMKAFPLTVTATTDGHVGDNGSLHLLGEAVDLGGAPDVLQRAGAWVGSNFGRKLLEGIHNNTLSIKNGKSVGPGFWGAKTWAAHRNHIHVAAAGGGGLGAAAGAAGAAAVGAAAGAAGAAAYQKSQTNQLTRRSQLASARYAIQGLGGIMTASDIRSASAAPQAGVAGGGGGGGGGGVAAGGGGTSGQNQALGKRMMLAHGWGAGQWPALKSLWQGESSWSQFADTRVSGLDPKNASVFAYGIPQSRPYSKMPHAAWPSDKGGTSSVRDQIAWGLDYIAGAYGSPASAWAFKSGPGAGKGYAMGGRVPKWGGWHQAGLNSTFSTPTLIGVGEGGKSEKVRVTPTGARGGGRGKVEATFHIYGANDPKAVAREVEKAMMSFARHLDDEPIDGEDIG